jgi:hypothetical protein
MLLAAVLDHAHGFAGPLVVDIDVGPHAGEGRVRLLMRIEAVLVALVLARDVIGQLVEREPLAPHLLPIHRRPEAGEDRVPVMPGIIDRHMPLGDRHLAAHGNDEGIGKHQVGDPHMGLGIADAAQAYHPQAEFSRLDLDARARKFAHDAGHRQVGIDRAVAEQLAVA